MKAKLSMYIAAMLMLAVLLSVGCSKPAARNDAQIASDVQNKIYSDPSLQGKQIAVQANGGVVTLSGYVDNDAQRNAASNDAGAVEGVKQVMNNLQVQQAAQMPADQQAQQAQQTPPPASAAPARSSNRGTSRGMSRANTPSYSSGGSAGSQTAYNAGQSAPAQNVAPAAPAPPRKVTVPDGTTMSVRLVDPVDSETAHVGDPFRASLNAPVIVDDQVVVPENADVEGRVVNVQSAGKFKGASVLTLELTKLQYNGQSYQVQSNQWTKQGSSRGKNTAAKVGTGAAIGAIIGGIAGGGKGAAIGAGVGAGAGTGVQAVTKGEQIKLGSETVLNFQLQNPVTVTPAQTLNRDRGRRPMNE